MGQLNQVTAHKLKQNSPLELKTCFFYPKTIHLIIHLNVQLNKNQGISIMQHLLTHKTASLTEMRDPAKVLEGAGDSPVAILNRNKVVGYFIPDNAVNILTFEPASDDEILKTLKSEMNTMAPVLKYLQDK